MPPPTVPAACDPGVTHYFSFQKLRSHSQHYSLSVPFLFGNHQVLPTVFSSDSSDLCTSVPSMANLMDLDIIDFACTASILIHSLLSRQNFVEMQVSSYHTRVWNPLVTSVDYSSEPSIHPLFSLPSSAPQKAQTESPELLAFSFPPKIIYSSLRLGWSWQSMTWTVICLGGSARSDWSLQGICLTLSPSLALTAAFQFLKAPTSVISLGSHISSLLTLHPLSLLLS